MAKPQLNVDNDGAIIKAITQSVALFHPPK